MSTAYRRTYQGASIRNGWEKAKEGLVEIAKGVFKWCLILGAVFCILF